MKSKILTFQVRRPPPQYLNQKTVHQLKFKHYEEVRQLEDRQHQSLQVVYHQTQTIGNLRNLRYTPIQQQTVHCKVNFYDKRYPKL